MRPTVLVNPQCVRPRRHVHLTAAGGLHPRRRVCRRNSGPSFKILIPEEVVLENHPAPGKNFKNSRTKKNLHDQDQPPHLLCGASGDRTDHLRHWSATRRRDRPKDTTTSGGGGQRVGESKARVPRKGCRGSGRPGNTATEENEGGMLRRTRRVCEQRLSRQKPASGGSQRHARAPFPHAMTAPLSPPRPLTLPPLVARAPRDTRDTAVAS